MLLKYSVIYFFYLNKMKLKPSIIILSIASIIILFSCSQSDSTKTEVVTPIFHQSHEDKKKDAPFSDVVQVGNLYFLAGQIGMNHATRTLVEGGIEAETKQTLENIKDVLEQHSLQMKDVVKATVILDTIGDFASFNKVYIKYFPQKPARTTFAVESLARGAKIEIEVIAVK